MKKHILPISILLLFISCSDKKEPDFLSMPSVPIHGVVYDEDILSDEQIDLAALDSCLLLCSPNKKDACLTIDQATGKEIARFGKWGGGPGEFYYPKFAGKSPDNDTLYIANMPNAMISFIRTGKGEYTFLESKQIYLKQLDFMMNISRVENGFYIMTTLSGGQEFFILLDKNLHEIKRFGHHPVKGMTAKANDFIPFNGSMTTYKNSFYYATGNMGYIVRYDISDSGNATLVWEKTIVPPVCSIYEANISFKMRDNRDGFYGLAANDTYLFAAYSGVITAEAIKDPSACLPKTMVVFNQEGKIVGKYGLEHKSTYPALSKDNSELYVWNWEPEINIERFKVNDILSAK